VRPPPSQKPLFEIDAQYHTKGSVVFKWHPQGAFLATCGSNRVVNIFNRQGVHQTSISLEGTGKCLQLDWDPKGETLAILQSGSPIVKLWDANQQVESSLDTLMKDLTYLRWSSTKPLLAIGTAKGNLLLYDKFKQKKQSIMGKHSRRIVGGEWNGSAELALASDDKQVRAPKKAALRRRTPRAATRRPAAHQRSREATLAAIGNERQ
jgi:WD repeat-containing protein 19